MFGECSRTTPSVCPRRRTRGDERVPGGVGVARLDPERAGVVDLQQRVVVVEVELAALDRERQHDLAAAHDPPQPLVLQHRRGERGEVVRAGVVALVLQAVGAREARAAEVHLPRLGVHLRDEALQRPRHALRQRDRRVVARREHQPVEHRLQPDALAARQQADARALVPQRLLGDPDGRVLGQALGHQQRGHHLRDRGDRQAARRVARPQHLAGVEVEQHPGARLAAEPRVDPVGLAELHRQRGRRRPELRAVGGLPRRQRQRGRRRRLQRSRRGRRHRRRLHIPSMRARPPRPRHAGSDLIRRAAPSTHRPSRTRRARGPAARRP